MNLLDMVKGQIGPMVMDKASEYLGESSSNTQSALGAILPSVIGGVISNASTTSGAKSLLDLLSKDDNDGGILDNLSGLMGDNNGFQKVMGMGGPLVSMLFGNKLDGILDLITGHSGVKRSSASSLISLTAPVVIGLLSKKVKTEGLGISGLANYLMGQSSSIKSALPAGFTDKLGFGNLGDFLGDAKVDMPTGSTSGFGKFLPWLLGILALVAALYFLRTCNKEKLEEIAMAGVDSTAAVVDSAATSVTDAEAAALAFINKSLPDGVELNYPDGGTESKLIAFIEDQNQAIDKELWFEFDRLYFKTASSELEDRSMEQLNNITAIMKAFPKVKLKIGGYTDNTGDPKANLKLSGDRAKTALDQLVKNGVAGNRLKSEGYGDQHPIGDNTTEEGRQMNRRVAVRVTEK